jgi:MFS family permease
MLRHRGLLICHHLAFGLGLMITYGQGFWQPEFLVRTFGWDIAYVGSLLASLAFAASLIGQFSAVQVIGLFTRRGHADAVMRGYIFMMVFATVGSILAFSTANPVLTVAGLLISNIVMTSVLTFGSSALQLFAPQPLRGRLSGIFISVGSLMGLGLGPSVVGALTEYVLGGKQHIGTSLLIYAVTVQLAIMVFLALGLAPARRAMAEVTPHSARGPCPRPNAGPK